MSEATDQPVVDAPTTGADTGVDATAPATTTDDIDTEAFDRMDAPDDDAPAAGDGDADGDGDPDKPKPAEDPDHIEVEVGGQKLKVPKALEPLLLMQSDYTRKTQELADQRRQIDATAETLEAERAQQVESLKAFRNEHMAVAAHEASIAHVDTQLAEYRKLTAQDWANLKASDPAAYTQHADNYDFLKRTRDASDDALKAAQKDLTEKEAKLTERQQAARNEGLAKAWSETNATLSKKIEGWSPAKGQELGKMLVEQFGVTPEELREATDARVWIMADELTRLRAENARLKTTSTQAKATEAALKSQTVTPAARPAGGGARPTGVRDELSTKEWMARRNAAEARKRA